MFFGGQPVKGADAGSFEPLLGPWARDRGSVYAPRPRRAWRASRRADRDARRPPAAQRLRETFRHRNKPASCTASPALPAELLATVRLLHIYRGR